MSQYQYSKVSACVWRDRGFRGLSVDGKLVWMYVLTCPGLRSFGAMFATVPGMAAELGMGLERFEVAWGEVLGSGMVRFDGEAGLVVVPKFLRHNPPASPNVVRSWRKQWVLLPECELLDEYLQEVRAFIEGFGEGFGKAFREGFGEGNANPSPNLLTDNCIKIPPISPQGGSAMGEEELVVSGQGSGVGEGEGEDGTDGTEGDGGAAAGGAGAGEILAVEGSGRRRGRRKGLGAGDDPLAGLSVLSEAYGVFRERLVGVHGAKATLAAPGVERGVLARLVREGFEERDVVAVLKWVLWEEPGPRVPGGFCWRDQFRSFGGLVKPTRNGEMKFKAMAAAYEAWARQVGGVAARARGTGGHGQGAGERGPGPGREEIGVADGPRLRFVVV